jgi:FO synthase/2-phospho-L-lactate guanylyltransferase
MTSAAPPTIWAVVPIKALDQAKSRLAAVLEPTRRVQLVVTMLHHTLEVLASLESLAGTAVISADDRVRHVADAYGATWISEAGSGGLNTALVQASTAVQVYGAEGMLVLPGDLPRLSAESLTEALDLLPTPGVVVTPDQRGRGTNLLLVSPPNLIPFAFGPNSFQRHVRAAADRDIPVVVFEHDDLAGDVDLPGDLALTTHLSF